MMKRIFVIIAVSLMFSLSFAGATNISNMIIEKNQNLDPPSCNGDGIVNRWAVIIGTDPGALCDEDAIDMRNVLLSNGWNNNNINFLITNNAEKNDILNSIDWLNQKGDSDDIVMFYFSGHGGRGLIASYKGYIYLSELENKFSSFQSNKMLLIFDCCNAGSLPRHNEDCKIKSEFSKIKFNNEFYRELITGLGQPGRVILAACRSYENSAADLYLDNGIFSYYLMDGFNGYGDSDSNGDGWISAVEAFNYAYPKTVAKSLFSQHPVVYNGCSEEIMVTEVKYKTYTETSILSNLLSKLFQIRSKLEI